MAPRRILPKCDVCGGQMHETNLGILHCYGPENKQFRGCGAGRMPYYQGNRVLIRRTRNGKPIRYLSGSLETLRAVQETGVIDQEYDGARIRRLKAQGKGETT